MPTSKTGITVQTSATNVAAGTTTSTAVDLTTDYGLFITAKITNGATGPTTPCNFNVEVSNDNVNWREIASFSAGTLNNGIYDFSFIVDITVMYARTVFTGNTGQSVTVEALGHQLTAV